LQAACLRGTVAWGVGVGWYHRRVNSLALSVRPPDLLVVLLDADGQRRPRFERL